MLSLSAAFVAALFAGAAYAQPSPKLQQRISAAIQAAKNSTSLDYTAFVNPFIGTGVYNTFSQQLLSHIAINTTDNFGDVLYV